MKTTLIRRVKDSDQKNYAKSVKGWINTSNGRIYATANEAIAQHYANSKYKLTIDCR